MLNPLDFVDTTIPREPLLEDTAPIDTLGYLPMSGEEEVSGTDMHRASRTLDMTDGKVKSAMQRLATYWSGDEIVRADYMRRGKAAEVLVHPDVAYELARKSPTPVDCNMAVTALGALHGGKIPLKDLAYVLGAWDSLVTEGFNTQNGRRFR